MKGWWRLSLLGPPRASQASAREFFRTCKDLGTVWKPVLWECLMTSESKYQPKNSVTGNTWWGFFSNMLICLESLLAVCPGLCALALGFSQHQDQTSLPQWKQTCPALSSLTPTPYPPPLFLGHYLSPPFQYFITLQYFLPHEPAWAFVLLHVPRDKKA